MRKLASIVQIESVIPHPNADRLSIAMMKGKGWKVITARDEFKSGDLAIFFEIDSFLAADEECYAFLRERCLRKFVSKSGQVLREGIRIKTCKLRGELSQGLLMPLSAFGDRLIGYTELGTDVTELLHVEHYDDVAAALAPATGGGNPVAADAMGKFPSDYIPKTDEERIQNLTEYFETMKGRLFEITEKNDGSSITMFYSLSVDAENPFGVCSRNLRLKPQTEKGDVPLAWKMAAKYDVETKLRALNEACGSELALQGELVGPGINKNRDMYKDYEWHIFKIWDIKNQKYLVPANARFACKSVGLEHVPVIEEECPVFERFANADELLKFAEGKTAHGNEREGLVFKSVDYPYVTFKAVSNRYLLGDKS